MSDDQSTSDAAEVSAPDVRAAAAASDPATSSDAPAATTPDAGATPAAATAGAGDDAPGPAAPRRAASAASRARRIGGGISPAPARTPQPGGAKPQPAARAGSAVSVEKRPTERVRTAAPDTEQAEAPAPVKKKRTLPPWLAWAPAGVFALVAIVFLALFVASRVGGNDNAPTSSKQRQTVLAAAKNCVAATNTYKYTAIDTYERAGLACATGQYKTQYRTAMDTLVKKNAPTQKFTQIAQVNLAGVESVTKDGKQWAVLIYGQLNITNTQTGKQGRIDPFAVVATMEQVKGTWLMAGVRLLSSV